MLSSLSRLHLVVSGSADQAIQAIRAMQDRLADDMLMGLGALCVTGNEGDKTKAPRRKVSTRGFAAFNTSRLSLKSIHLSVSPDWK